MVLDKLNKKEIGIVELYTQILQRAQYEIACTIENEDMCIWKEHVRTSIIRTILENCYPFVMKEREVRGKKRKDARVLVINPKDEFHELGAMMVADFFRIAGFEVIYVGSNTPWQSFIAAIKTTKPSIIAISVTNPYHLSKTKHTIEEIRAAGLAAACPFKIIVGGQAFERQAAGIEKTIGADMLLKTFEQITKLEVNP